MDCDLYDLDWGHEPNYTMPALSVQPNFTSEMRNWVLFFMLVIIAVAVVSHFQWSFFWVTIPTMAFGLVGVYVSSGGVDNVSEASPAAGNIGSADRRKSAVVDCLASLPYSIIAFALVFLSSPTCWPEKYLSRKFWKASFDYQFFSMR